MKAFKYLVFFIILFISSFASALEQCKYINSTGPIQEFSSVSALCDYVHKFNGWTNNGCTLSGNLIYDSGWSQVGYKVCEQIQCPSATSRDLKVAVNSKSYVCVQGCQYRLRACVDVDMEPGMTCSAISTGQDCGTNPPPKTPDPNKPPTDP